MSLGVFFAEKQRQPLTAKEKSLEIEECKW